VTFAAGLAAGGLKPFCTIYSTFLQRGYDQVLHDVCIQNLPVRFFMDRAGLVGDDGPTHHGAFDLSFLGSIPNMTIFAPRDTTELREAIRFAAGFDSGPLAVRYPRGAADADLPEARTLLQYGKAEVLERLGDGPARVAIVALGSMVGPAWAAAKDLHETGLEAVVVNARFAKPLDIATIAAVAAEAGHLVTVEENVAWGGFGEQVRRGLADSGLSHIPLRVLSLPDAFVEHGAQPIIRGESGLSKEAIVAAARELCSTSRRFSSK